MLVLPIPCLSDNYAYLVRCTKTGRAALVDPSEATPVLEALAKENVRALDAIWDTHHHFDHVGGNEEVAKALSAHDVIGHTSDRGRIPGQTRFVDEGDRFELGALRVRILHIPGHTTGAVAYVVEDEAGETAVFTGDTMFLAGCGRLFEGTPAMMHESLSKLRALPPSTRVYCGHEYTEANLRFAAHVEPSNVAIARRAETAAAMRTERRPTVPGTLADEIATNPFLRVDEPEIRKSVGIASSANSADALGAVRAAKDSF